MTYYSKLAEFYDRFTQRYDKTIHEPTFSYILEALEKSNLSPKRILDLGCGTGYFDKFFVEKGYQVVGIDLSPDMLQYALERGVECHRSSIEDFDLGERFDLIFSTGDVINHISYPEECFACVRKHLTDKGIFVFDFYTMKKLEEIPKYSISLRPKEYVFEGAKILWMTWKAGRIKKDKLLFVDETLKMWKEVITEAMYEKEEMVKIIEDAGLKVLDIQELQGDKKLLVVCKHIDKKE